MLPRVLAVWLLLGALLGVSAHPISQLIFRIDVDDEGISIRIRSNLEDATSLLGVESDLAEMYSVALLRQSAQSYHALLVQRLRLLNVQGEALHLQLVSQDVPVSTDLRFPDLAAQPIELVLRCSQVQDVRDCSIITDLRAVSQGISLTIQAEVHQQDSLLARALWADGVLYPLVDAEATTDLPMMMARPHPAASHCQTFVTVTRRHVRLDLLLPYLAVEAALQGVERSLPDRIDREAQAQVRQRLGDWLSDVVDISLDGQQVPVRLLACEFLSIDGDQELTDTELPVRTTRIGVQLDIASQSSPEQVAVTWKWFNALVGGSMLGFHIYGQRGHQQLNQEQDRMQWQGTVPEMAALAPVPRPAVVTWRQWPVVLLLALPVCAFWLLQRRFKPALLLLLLAALIQLAPMAWYKQPVLPALPAASDMRAVVAAVHDRIYRSFASADEHKRYALLEEVAHDDYLTELYLSIAKQLHVQGKRGVLVSVEGVDIGKVAVQSGDAHRSPLTVLCDWQVLSRIMHWGHAHQRRDAVRAQLQFVVHDGAWQLQDMQVLAHDRQGDA